MDGLLLKIWKLNKVSKCKVIRYGKSVASSGKNKFHLEFTFQRLHRGVFCQFPFRRIYYYGSNNSTGKEISKTHLCGLYSLLKYAKNFMIHEWEACSAYFD